jgi:multidrug efflux pump subunit AcrB
MWIVRLALKRPYTFVVMSLLIALLGAGAALTTPTDIFPKVDIPVINVVWLYRGLPTADMEKQITIFSEYTVSSAVSNVKNIESQTVSGISVIKIYFHPGADIAGALAEVSAVSQTILRRMPPGTNPPLILRYNASSVPILQLSITSKSLSESQLYDWGLYQLRQQLSVVQGTRLPLPYGGTPRQISVDLDPQALQANGISPQEVNLAINAQNLTLPTGSAKIGEIDYMVSLNSSPEIAAALNDVPVKRVNGRTIFLRDVAQVHDGFQVQTNIVRRDGTRGVLATILKSGDASTLEIAAKVKELLPTIKAAAPKGIDVDLLVDQSTFVAKAIDGVLVEGIIAAGLTAVMILLFLGSWRSTLIVAVSIPLSILSALIALKALGQTINVMTLGGLALAVGILVDDATVEIENIHRNLAQGKPLVRAILDGAQQIAVPAFVATLAITIVFVSVVFLDGAAKYLFTPMALAVGFSVMASYLLSRTIIPTLVKYLLRGELEHHDAPDRPSIFGRVHSAFNQGFERLRDRYVAGLGWALGHRPRVFALFGLALLSAALIAPQVGRDFFPKVDAGQIRLHVTAPAGTRLEETERVFSRVEEAISRVIPASDREAILDNIGLPDGINLGITDTANLSTADGEILVSLRHDRQGKTEDYIRRLREALPREFPGVGFYFQPADIVTQILNFGLSSPIDIQVAGYNGEATYKAAREIESRLAQVRGAADVHLHQVIGAPRLHLNVDRVRAGEAGLTQRDVANSVLVSLSSSFVVQPSYWADPRSGINYPVSVQTPQHEIHSIESIDSIPLTAPGLTSPQLLGDLGTIERKVTPIVATHANVQPTFNVRADVQDRDLGSVGAEIQKIAADVRGKLPPGSSVTVRGQVESMSSSFVRLGIGIFFAAVLVYFLMVVNFQSWSDPFIIITALPGALVGIVWMLFATQTTFSVPSLMGAIMTVGVATANSILVVTFANGRRGEGKNAVEAALDAGHARLRPVLMTALAMILGMLPMALGLSEGGEQNAALGRAVIGGLLVATFATLFFVPVVFSLVSRSRKPADPELADLNV